MKTLDEIKRMAQRMTVTELASYITARPREVAMALSDEVEGVPRRLEAHEVVTLTVREEE
jgi:hypothetical protein